MVRPILEQRKQAPYSFKRGRWGCARPYPLRWSEMVLGRRATQAAIIEQGAVTVSCYETRWGSRFFTNPVNPRNRAGSRVLYRIRVTLKEGVLP